MLSGQFKREKCPQVVLYSPMKMIIIILVKFFNIRAGNVVRGQGSSGKYSGKEGQEESKRKTTGGSKVIFTVIFSGFFVFG